MVDGATVVKIGVSPSISVAGKVTRRRTRPRRLGRRRWVSAPLQTSQSVLRMRAASQPEAAAPQTRCPRAASSVAATPSASRSLPPRALRCSCAGAHRAHAGARSPIRRAPKRSRASSSANREPRRAGRPRQPHRRRGSGSAARRCLARPAARQAPPAPPRRECAARARRSSTAYQAHDLHKHSPGSA